MNKKKFANPPKADPALKEKCVFDDVFRPLPNSTIREIYVRGMFRNVFSVLSAIFGDEVNTHGKEDLVNSSNRDRGDFNFDLVNYLFASKQLVSVSRRLSKAFKSSKQGNVSYHELALAHCLLCTMQYIQFGKHDRHSEAITTSMAMGRIIRPLDLLTIQIFERKTPEEFAVMKDREIHELFPHESKNLATAIEKAKQVNTKSSRLNKLDLTAHRLAAAYSIIKSSGVNDRQPFEKFLGAR